MFGLYATAPHGMASQGLAGNPSFFYTGKGERTAFRAWAGGKKGWAREKDPGWEQRNDPSIGKPLQPQDSCRVHADKGGHKRALGTT